MKKLKFKLMEAKSIDSEYSANWKDIPRDVFDKIITLDPQTSIEKNNIGPNAKQLLLPKYLEGEHHFLEEPDEVKKALELFIRNRGAYMIKNVALYPSVDIFVKHIQDPENNPVEVSGDGSESKIDKIYKQYYSDIEKEKFIYIITLDPATNIEKGSIGNYAKNLLLRLYKRGDQKIGDPDYRDAIVRAINYIEENKNVLDKKYQQLNTIDSIDTIIALPDQVDDSDHLKYLKESPYWSHIRYVGSTQKYDVFVPLDYIGAAAIAGADDALRLPSGTRGPGIDASGSKDWRENLYAHWCTSSKSFWSNYNKEGQLYYDFMARGENLWADSRKHNYQLAIREDGYIDPGRGVADGIEDYTHANIVRPRLFSEDTSLYRLLAKEESYASNLPEVKSYLRISKVSDTFVYSGEADYFKFFAAFEDAEIKILQQTVFKKLIIADSVTIIPPTKFKDWGISEIIFGKNVKTIGSQAFKGCVNLRLLRLPEKLEYIGAQAFASCIALHGTTTIHNSIKKIGRQAFYDVKDITLSILSDREDGSLIIDPKDKQWFADHAKFVDVTNEEVTLDEKVPRDLANIYRKNLNRAPTHRGHDVNKAVDMYVRRGSQYNYEEAQYEVISAEEAYNRVLRNKVDVEKVRAIFGDSLLECELRNNGKIYPIHIPTIPGYDTDVIRHKVQSNKGLRELWDMADKIYWTDEYEHVITPDSSIANKRKQNDQSHIQTHYQDPSNLRVTSEGDPQDPDVEIDGVPYYLSNYDTTHVNYSVDTLDTGNHWSRYVSGGGGYRAAAPYNDACARKNRAHKVFNDARKALDNVIKNKNLYDEEEYEILYTELLRHKEETYTKYQEAYNRVVQEKKRLLSYYSEQMYRLNKIYRAAMAKSAALKKRIESMERSLNDLKQNLSRSRDKQLAEEPEYQLSVKHIEALEQQIMQTYRDNAQRNAQIAEYEQKIVQLKQLIKNGDDEALELTRELESQYEELEVVAEKISRKISDEIDTYEAAIEELKDAFVRLGVKKFDKKKHKELSDALARMLTLLSDEEDEDED